MSARRWSERPKTVSCHRRCTSPIESGRQRDRAGGKPIIVLWGLAENRPLYRLDQWAEHLAFSPDGRTLLGVGRDGNAQVWDPRNGTLRETIRVCEAGHFAIRDIAVAPDSRHFAAGLGNGTARIFRLKPAPERVEPRNPLPIVAVRPEPPVAAARPEPPVDVRKRRVNAKLPGRRDPLDSAWALADGQVLKRVGPPYPPERPEVFFYNSRGPSDARASQIFRWDGRLHDWGTLGSSRLQDVLVIVLRCRRGEFDGHRSS